MITPHNFALLPICVPAASAKLCAEGVRGVTFT